jgi:hypothetical protein
MLNHSIMNKRVYKTSIARAFFTTAAWVLNVGGVYIEWVCRHTFDLIKLLGKGWWHSYRQQYWPKMQRILPPRRKYKQNNP